METNSDSVNATAHAGQARKVSEARHTPGPWKVAEHSWCETTIYAGGRTIACLDINDATEETQEAMEALMAADARLIVAAPDLLQALGEYMQAVELYSIAMKDGINVHGAMSGLIGAEANANAAIAKATGSA